jgi:hypothetical protein
MTLLPQSALATHAHNRLSDRYGFIPTNEIVDAFSRDGWVLTKGTEAKVRTEARKGLQRHLLRFAHESQLSLGIRERIETILVNSHDGTSSLQIGAGIFRMACANGIVVADSTVASIRLGHHKLEMDTVLNSAHTILGQAQKVSEVIECWKGTQISKDDAFHLAEQGIKLRWPVAETQPVTPTVILGVNRQEDVGSDLWTVFNRIQENVIRGGQHDNSRRTTFGKRFRATRTVKSLTEDVRINKGLWEIASQFAQ